MGLVKLNSIFSFYFLLVWVSFGFRDFGFVFIVFKKIQIVMSWCVFLQNYFYLFYGDVKNVVFNRVGYGYVFEFFSGYYDIGDKIRDGGFSS